MKIHYCRLIIASVSLKLWLLSTPAYSQEVLSSGSNDMFITFSTEKGQLGLRSSRTVAFIEDETDYIKLVVPTKKMKKWKGGTTNIALWKDFKKNIKQNSLIIRIDAGDNPFYLERLDKGSEMPVQVNWSTLNFKDVINVEGITTKNSLIFSSAMTYLQPEQNQTIEILPNTKVNSISFVLKRIRVFRFQPTIR